MRPSAFIPVKTCASRLARVFVFAVILPSLGAEQTVSPAPAPVRRYSHATAWFDISGETPPPEARIAGLCRRVGDALTASGFSAPEMLRVPVYLESGDDSARAVVAYGEGRVSVRIPRAAFTDERACAEALARASLVRLAQEYGRKPAPAAWGVEALAWEARLALDRSEFSSDTGAPGMVLETGLTTAPVFREHLSRLALAEGPASLAALDAPREAGGEVSERLARQSYWLLAALRTANAGDRRAPLADASIGIPLKDTLARCVPGYASGGEATAAWWPTAFYATVSSHPPVALSPGESGARLDEFSRFVISENGADRALGFEGLIERRANPSLRAGVLRRVAGIKLELGRVNPVWRNAYLAYGIFLEKLLSASPEELRRLALDATAEIKFAKETSSDIRRALEKPVK